MNEKEQKKHLNTLENIEFSLAKLANELDNEDDSISTLKCFDALNSSKDDCLKRFNDSYLGISWADFIKIVENYGFKEAYSKDFTSTNFLHSNEKVKEKEVFYSYSQKNLILHAESFGNYVCSAKVYGEIIGNIDTFNKEQLAALAKCSYIPHKNNRISIIIPVVEGFKTILNSLFEILTFSLQPWSYIPFICFSNYAESKKITLNHKKISDEINIEALALEKLNSSSDELKKIVNI